MKAKERQKLIDDIAISIKNKVQQDHDLRRSTSEIMRESNKLYEETKRFCEIKKITGSEFDRIWKEAGWLHYMKYRTI